MKKNLISLAFLSVLAISLATNVYLGRMLLGRKASLASGPQQMLRAKTGQRLDGLHTEGLTGAVETISLSGRRRTVLYVFSPNCHWCTLNLKNIQALFAKSKYDYDFIGIAVNSKGLEDYLKIHPYGFPIYKDSKDADLQEIGFLGTPQTILIDTTGKVEENWVGAYAGTVGDSIEHTFSVHLPGLEKQSTSVSLSTPAFAESR